MKIVDYIDILWRRKWIIVVVTVTVLPVVILASRRLPVTYSTSAKVRIATPTYGTNDWVGFEVRYGDRLLATYVEIAKTDPVIEKLAARLEVQVNKLPKMDVKLLTATEIIEISAESSKPELARDAANEMADILVTQEIRFDYINEVSAQRKPAFIVEKAGLPSVPRGINGRTFILLGAVMGLAGGVGLAILFESLDTRMHAVRHIAGATSLPLLGTIQTLKRRKGSKRDTSCDGALRIALRLAPPDSAPPYKTLMIASALPAEGRSTVLAELALALAGIGQRVLLVDANLRQPGLHKLFELENSHGLSQVLQGEAQADDVIQTISTDKPLSLLTGGAVVAQPARLLASDALPRLLSAVSAQFDVILVDTPPLLGAPDALFLAKRVDAVLPLVTRGQTPRPGFISTIQQLVEHGAVVPGFIINRAPKGLTTGLYADVRASIVAAEQPIVITPA